MASNPPLLYITGASSGIGQALAARFARSGYRLALVARRTAEMQATLASDRQAEASAMAELAAALGPSDLDAMVAHPVLVERPIVVSARGAVLARPSERVFGILDNVPAAFVKEDGERVVPGNAPKT